MARRADEPSQMACAFQVMAHEVAAKELKIEIDQTKRDCQVEEIIQSDYFQQLKANEHSFDPGAIASLMVEMQVSFVLCS